MLKTPKSTDRIDTRIGYVVVESNRLDRWRVFGAEGLGMHVDTLEDGALVFRLDDRQVRILVRPGKAEDVVALGWEFEDEIELAAMRERLSAHGVSYERQAGSEALQRGVDDYWVFDGPKGLRMELFAGPRKSNQPLRIKGGGFVAGELGLGHVAILTQRPEAVIDQLQALFDARLSDNITDRLSGIEMEFTFLHMNPRHHSVAVAATAGRRVDPIGKRVQHLMIEAASLDDVSQAYRRCKDLGFRIAMSVGQHPNDQNISFYVVTPSGFEMELGWNPVLIEDEASWVPETYRGISKWGHRPEGKPSLGEVAAALGRVVGSIIRPAG
ncbi:VOC family protein [Caulobacter hibisci]|uniref:VOC family protein n=1 Tax=Caulobacter hibisci TaxID=2035993 RepID=A0ABS0SWV1_9CAUL|nr:VOC family protein [Caulobacter hibisci]MBI1684115.1 VOC family protein [Caulobacter hibisci]